MRRELTYTSELSTSAADVFRSFHDVFAQIAAEGRGTLTDVDPPRSLGFDATVAGPLPGPRPHLYIRISIEATGEKAATVSLTIEQNPRFRTFYILSGIIALFLGVPPFVNFMSRVMLDAPITIRSYAIGVSGIFIGFLTIAATSYVNDVIVLLRNRIERDLWNSVSTTERGILTAMYDGPQRGSLTSRVLALPIILGLLLLILWVGQHGSEAVYVAIFLLVPMILALMANDVAQELPLQFAWRSQFIPIAATWYAIMFLPLAFTVVRPSSWSSGLATLSDLANIPFTTPNALATAIIVGYVQAAISAAAHVKRSQARYSSVLDLPSLGKETLCVASRARLHTYHALAALAFLLMSVGTVLGTIRIWNRFRPTSLWQLLATAPLLIFALATLRRATLRLIGDVMDVMQEEDGCRILDQITRSGLYSDLCKELRARRLFIRRGTASTQGATIRSVLGLPGFFIIALDASIFASLPTREQREAVLWHEAGHHKEPFAQTLWALLLFHIWSPHVQAAMRDSLAEELRADESAVKRMRSAAPLSGALAILSTRGSGRPRPIQSIGDGLKLIGRACLGDNDIGYWHPHVTIRRDALAVPASAQEPLQ